MSRTLEEWLESYAPTAPERLDDCVKEAWNAATLAEREACADICDELKSIDYCVDVRQAAAAIRARTE